LSFAQWPAPGVVYRIGRGRYHKAGVALFQVLSSRRSRRGRQPVGHEVDTDSWEPARWKQNCPPKSGARWETAMPEGVLIDMGNDCLLGNKNGAVDRDCFLRMK
jgi:hypothetical protein